MITHEPSIDVVSSRVAVTDSTMVGEARRLAASVAGDAGVDEDTRGRLAIVATELATNLARHARDGMLLVRPVVTPAGRGIELLALDKGPGIRDLQRALEDGYSTGGTAGQGLGAIRRQADEFALYSHPETGTAILARVVPRAGGVAPDGVADATGLETGVVCVPLMGERYCGDGWQVAREGTRLRATMIDGLGHGPAAAEAAEVAMGTARRHAGATPAMLIERMHEAMRGTRGAAVAVADIDTAGGTVQFAGVGNISAVLLGGERQTSMASHAGIVGHQLRKVQEFTHPWSSARTLVLHSDGLATRWRVEQYPGIMQHHPALLAGVLFRDHARGRDDASALVVQPHRGARHG